MNTNTSTTKRATSARNMAVVTFCLTGLVLFAVSFGSYYLTWCGPNFVPFSDWSSDHQLWRAFIVDGFEAAIGAFAAALAIFHIVDGRIRDEKPQAAA
jgi:hypothetical protein